MRLVRACVAALLVLGATGAAFAQAGSSAITLPTVPGTPVATEATGLAPVPNNSVAIMLGVFTRGYWGQSFDVTHIAYESNYVLALISGKDLLTTSWGLRIGHESGIALRFGSGGLSLETWQGLRMSLRTETFGHIIATPTLVLGTSTVTNSMGVEATREGEQPNADATLLFYLGSEVAEAAVGLPELEAFYRLHHRSGALYFWGDMRDGLNVNSLGIRLRY